MSKGTRTVLRGGDDGNVAPLTRPIDWDFRDDTFHNQWQSYRTRKEPKLQCAVSHTYDEPGTYTVLVKVIDILGNDTTKSVIVEVG